MAIGPRAYARYTISISKAINSHESPVKEKHVRSSIIGTFDAKGGHTFWSIVNKLPILDNRIVAWKFCHVLHKVLREGHRQVLPHSQKYKGKIQDVGKLWGHLREGYGRLISLYTKLLSTKLDFHRKNPGFPGNLIVTQEELERIGENDINNYFQMSVEMFDYMDDILELQAAIFGSLDLSRSNSMTSSGQCRLAPLIPCIQDSSQLYDYCVKILFKLHASLPPELLKGHRARFLAQFKVLREFYINANTLQYFKNLIQIPLLPDSPPNFLIQAELRSYVTPVVTIPYQPEPDEISEFEQPDGILIDTSDVAAANDLVDVGNRNGSVSPEQALSQRDQHIEQLQMELAHVRKTMQQVRGEYQTESDVLRDKLLELETELATRDSELMQEKQLKEDLLRHTEEASKYHEYEKRAKVMEEKFQKLKDVYTKLREEHIQLIRHKADIDKQLVVVKQTSEEHARRNDEISVKLQELAHSQARAEENLLKNVETEAELAAIRMLKDESDQHIQALTAKVEWLTKEKSSLESDVQDLLSQKQSLDVRLTQSEQRCKNVEESMARLKSEGLRHVLESCITESEEIVRHAVEEVDNPAISASTTTHDYFRGLIGPTCDALQTLESTLNKYQTSPDGTTDSLAAACVRISNMVANYVLEGKKTSNTSPDIEFGERIANKCKEVGKTTLTVLANIKNKSSLEILKTQLREVRETIEDTDSLMEELTGAIKIDSAETLGDLVDGELSAMDKAIEDAAKRIEEMLNESRKAHSGIKLEVNEKILDSCTNLMAAIRVLVQKSKLLQAEIVAQGRGTQSAKEFYKRNHRWTEGLISAAKAVATGAKFLLSSADKVVSGQGKFEQLVVASQEIAASTAQLVVASRVKAERNSSNLSALGVASKNVTQATGGVVATAKSCSQLIEETEEIDVSGLTLHQAKRLEMESQVRVLEFEAALDQERLKLAVLRRRHYQLAGEMEGWEKKDYEEK